LGLNLTRLHASNSVRVSRFNSGGPHLITCRRSPGQSALEHPAQMGRSCTRSRSSRRRRCATPTSAPVRAAPTSSNPKSRCPSPRRAGAEDALGGVPHGRCRLQPPPPAVAATEVLPEPPRSLERGDSHGAGDCRRTLCEGGQDLSWVTIRVRPTRQFRGGSWSGPLIPVPACDYDGAQG
jgi:hypothetical protein